MMLVPMPKKVVLGEGQFKVSSSTNIVLDVSCGKEELNSALYLINELEKKLNVRIRLYKSGKNDEKGIILRKSVSESEDYNITIKDDSVIIEGASAGIYYAIQTLLQIVENYGSIIPAMTIEDSPYFKNRGFYHDITRGKVPTLETLKALADKAAYYKINQLQLYVEHSFAFRHMSEVWSDSEPLTAEEILIFDQYCKERHIELVPSLSSFGHLYKILVSESFKELNETEDIKETFYWYDRQAHYTIDVSNEKSIEFIRNMIDEFIVLFSSNKFNICADETFDLGTGKSKKLEEQYGKGKLYVDFLLKIIEHVKKYDKQVMFWGDVIASHPEELERIPKDVICLNWAYSPVVNEKKVETIAKSGLMQYMCPGVSGWNRIINNMDNANTNIKVMVDYGRKYNAVGILNTDWGDFGHINTLAASMSGMVYGAALSWNPLDERDTAEMDKAISLTYYGSENQEITSIVRDISRVSLIDWLDVVCFTENKPEFIEGFLRGKVEKIDYEALIDGIKKCKEYEAKLINASRNIKEDLKVDVKELVISARGVALFDVIGLVIKKYVFKENVDFNYNLNDIAEEYEYWLNDYCKLWRQRNKESELWRIKTEVNKLCRLLRTIDAE